ncbi:MAG: YkgJ family cysteine cluster protein [Bacteroidales bacterium]|jgi:Fe-S-cluster containining protein|nr:YkgJ family cysteine cluster protein [Bacteroidales bacterium]
MYIERNLSKIKKLAAIREDDNYRFRAFLKGKDREKIDRIVHRLHKKIITQIDCSTCANCCSCLTTEVSETEINVLAHLENMSPEEFQDAYCEMQLGDICLEDMPCRYLNGKSCSIYENRPEQCKTFPYTHKPGFVSRSLGMIRYYEICPIVFNLMEMLKEELEFRRRF